LVLEKNSLVSESILIQFKNYFKIQKTYLYADHLRYIKEKQLMKYIIEKLKLT
jgi:hypothetical protein